MSRETKVGLIVAASFLLLVGSVVFYKLYMVPPAGGDSSGDTTAQADGPEKKQAAKKGPEKPSPDTAAPAVADAKPSPKEPPAAAAPDKAPPPPDAPIFATNKDNSPPPLPPRDGAPPAASGRPSSMPAERPGEPEKPGFSGAGGAGTLTRPGADASAAGGAPPPPDAPEAGKDARPGAPISKDFPPPPDTPEVSKDVNKDARPGFGEARPMPDTKSPPPPDAPSVVQNSGGRPGFDEKKPTFPSEPPAPPSAPVTKEGPRDAGRPGFDERPGQGGAPATETRPGMPEPPLALPRDSRTSPEPRGSEPPPVPPSTGSRPPSGGVPPANTFDRRYDSSTPIGKPITDAPATTDDAKRGIPVEIRPQPEVDSSPAPSGVRGSGSSVSFDEARYPVRAGDTYASISKLKYGSERYAEALALYNRERNPRMTVPQAGQVVMVPPAEILEKRYRTAINTGSAAPAEGTVAGRPDARRETPVAYNTGDSRPLTTSPAGGGVSPRPSFGAKDKTYRVRTGDTLWNIAKQTLGNGERWTEILRMNRDVLPEISRLQDGLILRLPADAKVDMTGTSP
jgi:nucleoid-associated protein YgaU